ncbi:MAG: Mur ligase family protein, partial [bacterium]|nr:Mur ligase family protein [bacterium]
IAGSKGKGSVANLVANYLSAIGDDTGLYTSPHVVDIRERIKINGKMVSSEIFVSAVSELKDFVEKVGGCDLTYFEILTVIALKIFVDRDVEYVVLEVGLGGRLDATNIVTPEISILTRVEMEHVGVLGNNMEEILNEKLGIVKDGVPLVSGSQSKEVRKLIEKKLVDKRDLYFVEGDFDRVLDENGRLAFMALRVLLGNTDQVVFDRVHGELFLIGHFDVRKIDDHDVVFDVAHTVSSTKSLLAELKRLYPDKKFVFLLSYMKGKQVADILRLIKPVAEKIVYTNSHDDRGEVLSKMAEIVEGEVEEDCLIAYKSLLNHLKKDQVLVVTGSNYLVGKILKQL